MHIRRRARDALMAGVWSLTGLTMCEQVLAQVEVPCKPVSERTSEVGCWTLADVQIGELSDAAVFWHLDTYPTRAAAEHAKGPRGAVIESLGKVWLSTIAGAGWRPAGGTHEAEIGPLFVKPGEKYVARYSEAVFDPGMTSTVHSHPGPEAWYTTTGEVCLETPDGKSVGRAGEGTVVPAGPPMQLTATGTERRRSLAIVLHPAAHPSVMAVKDWTPKGLCKN